MDRRDDVLRFRASPTFKAVLDRACEKLGVSAAVLIRHAVATYSCAVLDPGEPREEAE